MSPLASTPPAPRHERSSDDRPSDEEQSLISEEQGKAPAAHAPSHDLGPRVRRAAYVVCACALYLSIGPSLIIVNRTILRDRKFGYPMAVSGMGLLFSAAVSMVLIHCGCVRREHQSQITLGFCMSNLVPIGGALAATLASGNAVYLYLPVGFIQMLKAFTPTVTLTLLWLTGIEVPTPRVLLTVLGICAGTAIASLGEGSFNILGLGLMLIAEVSEATRLVLTQKLLQNMRFGVIEGQYYMAPVSALWLFSAAAVTELPRARLPHNWRHAISLITGEPLLFVSSAVLGLGVNLCTFLVIKSTNSVTLKVLGTARNAGLVLFSALFYDERITLLEGVGYGISLLAFFGYNYFKIKGL